MKTNYQIKVYITNSERDGEWWEYVKNDGSLSLWVGNTATLKRAKEFKTAAAAQKYAKTKKIKRFQIIELVPPVAPSITWGQTVVYEWPLKMHEPIPADFPVQPLVEGQLAKDKVTCGHCGLSWDDAIPTTYTPAPSARCPFEFYHLYPEG